MLRWQSASRMRLVFLPVTLSIAVWQLGSGMLDLCANPQTAVVWARVGLIGVSFLPTSVVVYLMHSLHMQQLHKRLFWFLGGLSTLFAALVWWGPLSVDVIEKHWWGYYPNAGTLGWALVGFVVVAFSLGCMAFRDDLRSVPRGSAFHKRLSLSFIGLCTVTLGAVDFAALLGGEIYPHGYIPMAVFLVLATYLELRHPVLHTIPAVAHGQVLSTVQNALLLTSLEGTIEMGNAAATRLLGYSDTELSEITLAEVLPQGIPWPSLLQDCFSSPDGAIREREMVWRAKDGSAIDVSVSASIVRRRDRHPVGIVLAALDISSRKRAETELRVYAQRLRNIHDLDRAILAAESPQAIAREALQHLAILLPGTMGSVARYDLPNNVCTVLAAGDQGRPVDEARERMTLSALGVRRRTVRQSSVESSDDIMAEADLVAVRRRLSAEGLTDREVRAYLRAHLVAQGEPVGALVMGSRNPAAFGEKEREIAKEVANVLAIALHSSARLESLKQAEARYRELFEGVPVGLFRTDPYGRMVDANAALKNMLGHRERRSPLRANVFELSVDGIDRARLRETIEREGAVRDFEIKVVDARGAPMWMQLDCLAQRDEEGCITAHEGSISDITQRKQAETQLVHDAVHDALTGLPNRAYLMERLRHMIARAKQEADYRFAVLFIDCDRFKVVNDSLGHSAGDLLLATVATRLSSCLRHVDAVARLGGDEFAILLDEIQDIADATMVAERIKDALSEALTIKDQDVFVTASIGIAVSEDRHSEPADILRDADIAMYRAKSAGRDRYEVFDTAMHTHVVESLRLETDLRRGLERKEFRLHYQPIVSLGTDEVACFEALVRWEHPERGLLLPEHFLALAEETGLILPLGRWVMREACRQAYSWNRLGPSRTGIGVSVNLSDKQFHQPDLDAMVLAALKEAGLDPSLLHLEITENVVMEDTFATRMIFDRLKNLGVRLHIDDFGTGFCSMSVLDHFPLDTLKMDRSFVSALGDNDQGRSDVLNAIVSVAHALHMQVVAEGVETVAQLDKLKVLDCEHAQGFYFARPMTAAAVRELLVDTRQWSDSWSTVDQSNGQMRSAPPADERRLPPRKPAGCRPRPR